MAKYNIEDTEGITVFDKNTNEVIFEQSYNGTVDGTVSINGSINQEFTDISENENNKNKWELLKEKLENHDRSMDDAPYFGWSGEFIRGYREAVARLQKDMSELEN